MRAPYVSTFSSPAHNLTLTPHLSLTTAGRLFTGTFARHNPGWPFIGTGLSNQYASTISVWYRPASAPYAQHALTTSGSFRSSSVESVVSPSSSTATILPRLKPSGSEVKRWTSSSSTPFAFRMSKCLPPSIRPLTDMQESELAGSALKHGMIPAFDGLVSVREQCRKRHIHAKARQRRHVHAIIRDSSAIRIEPLDTRAFGPPQPVDAKLDADGRALLWRLLAVERALMKEDVLTSSTVHHNKPKSLIVKIALDARIEHCSIPTAAVANTTARNTAPSGRVQDDSH